MHEQLLRSADASPSREEQNEPSAAVEVPRIQDQQQLHAPKRQVPQVRHEPDSAQDGEKAIEDPSDRSRSTVGGSPYLHPVAPRAGLASMS